MGKWVVPLPWGGSVEGHDPKVYSLFPAILPHCCCRLVERTPILMLHTFIMISIIKLLLGGGRYSQVRFHEAEDLDRQRRGYRRGGELGEISHVAFPLVIQTIYTIHTIHDIREIN